MFKTAIRRPACAGLIAAVAAGAMAVTFTMPVAYAQESDFAAADANKDGRVDRAEYEKRMMDVFYLADVNKDGVLEIEEVAVVERSVFERADTDNNDKVTLREFMIVRMADFDAADTNKDGALSKAEVDAWSASR